jgi:hypothetical protein
MPVDHNFATAPLGWLPGVPLASATHQTFLGAGFCGDRVKQLLAGKTVLNLSKHRPIEELEQRGLIDEVRRRLAVWTRYQRTFDVVLPSGGDVFTVPAEY